MDGLWCFVFCFFDVLQNVVNGDTEFPGAGVAFDAIVMTLDDVGECSDAEIIGSLL